MAITGGGTGIGAGIAKELAIAGAKVSVGGRREAPLRTLSDSVDSPNPIRTCVVDVANNDSIKAFFSDVRNNVGPVDILVNSAGINIVNRRMADMDPDDWDRVMQINASGAYRCIHQVLPSMRDRRDGLIINISSVAGKRAIALGGIAYCASKFAMTAMGTAVANEVSEQGIRVTNIYPGEVNTPILENRPVAVSDEHKASVLQPEDIAGIVLAICQLPPRACVPEIVIKPTIQHWA